MKQRYPLKLATRYSLLTNHYSLLATRYSLLKSSQLTLRQPIDKKMPQLWISTTGNQPIVAVALHDGHNVRPEVEQLLAISPDERKREEDPFTAGWTDIAESRTGTVLRSRFEVDLNRPRHLAIYLKPEDAWGLKVWKSTTVPRYNRAIFSRV